MNIYMLLYKKKDTNCVIYAGHHKVKVIYMGLRGGRNLKNQY